MAARPSIRSRLARPFDPAELRRIKRLWVRHSIAEDARDIDGLIATLSDDCVYEIVPTGQRWEGHAGARAFYTELFAAFPDNAFALIGDRHRAAGGVRGGDADRHEPGPVGRRARRPGWPSRSRSSSCSRGIPSRNGSPGSGSGSTAGRSDRTAFVPRSHLGRVGVARTRRRVALPHGQRSRGEGAARDSRPTWRCPTVNDLGAKARRATPDRPGVVPRSTIPARRRGIRRPTDPASSHGQRSGHEGQAAKIGRRIRRPRDNEEPIVGRLDPTRARTGPRTDGEGALDRGSVAPSGRRAASSVAPAIRPAKLRGNPNDMTHLRLAGRAGALLIPIALVLAACSGSGASATARRRIRRAGRHDRGPDTGRLAAPLAARHPRRPTSAPSRRSTSAS